MAAHFEQVSVEISYNRHLKNFTMCVYSQKKLDNTTHKYLVNMDDLNDLKVAIRKAEKIQKLIQENPNYHGMNL